MFKTLDFLFVKSTSQSYKTCVIYDNLTNKIEFNLIHLHIYGIKDPLLHFKVFFLRLHNTTQTPQHTRTLTAMNTRTQTLPL